MKVFVAESAKVNQRREWRDRKLLNELILTIKDTSEQSIASPLETSQWLHAKWHSEALQRNTQLHKWKQDERRSTKSKGIYISGMEQKIQIA